MIAVTARMSLSGVGIIDSMPIALYILPLVIFLPLMIRDYYQRYAPKLIDEPPVETVICIPALHEPDLLVEIDCIAVVSE